VYIHRVKSHTSDLQWEARTSVKKAIRYFNITTTSCTYSMLTTKQGDTTHGFVMWFDSEEDRDYYVNEDPAHKAFVQSAGPIIKAVRVVDFEPGEF